jgi:hypothetical protein
VIDPPDLPGCTAALDPLNLLLGAAGPADREPARNEEIPAVAVLDLDHVTRCAELVDGVSQDELHANTFLS